jgi:hypothetical protein
MVEQRPVDWQLFAGKRIEKLRDNGEPLASRQGNTVGTLLI